MALTNRKKAYETAHEFIQRLVDLGWVDEKLWNLVLMPGNHDICRADRTCDPLITRLEAEKEYRAFLCRLYGGNGFHSRRHLGYCHVLSTREDPPRPAVVLSLNSCRIETSFTPGLGWVGYDQIFKLIARDLPRRLAQWRVIETAGIIDSPLCIAALHHHLHLAAPHPLPMLLPDLESHKLPFLTDSPEVLDTLIDLGFQVILHGHAHLCRRYMYGSHPRRGLERDLAKAVIAGAGSPSLSPHSRNIHHSHQFQIVNFAKHLVCVRSYEAPLTAPRSERVWNPVDFDFEYSRDYDHSFDEVMRQRLDGNASDKARKDLERFESLVDFEALLQRSQTTLEKVLAGVYFLKFNRRISTAEPAAVTLREKLLRCVDALSEESRAKAVGTKLHAALTIDSTMRLDAFLLQEWEAELA